MTEDQIPRKGLPEKKPGESPSGLRKAVGAPGAPGPAPKAVPGKPAVSPGPKPVVPVALPKKKVEVPREVEPEVEEEVEEEEEEVEEVEEEEEEVEEDETSAARPKRRGFLGIFKRKKKAPRLATSPATKKPGAGEVKGTTTGIPLPEKKPGMRSSGLMKAITATGASTPKITGKARRERQDAVRERPKGIRIAFKFCLYVSGLVMVLTLVLGMSVSRIVEKEMDEEINKRGAMMAAAIALAETDYWTGDLVQAPPPGENSPRRGPRPSAKPEGGEKAEGGKPPAPAPASAPRRDPQEVLARILEDGGSKGGGDAEILDVYLLKGQGMIAAASGTRQVEFSSRNPREWSFRRGKDIVKTDIGISDGTLADGTPFRMFKKPMRSMSGVSDATAVVVLSAARIHEASGKVMNWIIILTGGAIGMGILLSLWLASLVTKPLRQLVHDISLVSRGDFDHRTLARTSDEVGLVAGTVDEMTKNLKKMREVEKESHRVEHDLSLAKEIQASLLPKGPPRVPGFEFFPFYRAAREVGGDYYDFIPVDREHLGVIVADVSGKGIPGSLVMSMTRSIMRSEALRTLSPREALVRTNYLVSREIKRGMFVTAAYAILNVRTGELLVASAGHNPLVIFREAAGNCELLNPKGIALGFDKGPLFEKNTQEGRIILGVGDRVVLYTDGVIEAMDAQNHEFGDKNFYRLILENARKGSEDFVKSIVARLDEHKGRAEQHDDITMVTFRRL
ncbi:MAG: SpoIIE family protein phosphatase [Planctomycetota bacterium]